MSWIPDAIRVGPSEGAFSFNYLNLQEILYKKLLLITNFSVSSGDFWQCLNDDIMILFTVQINAYLGVIQ